MWSWLCALVGAFGGVSQTLASVSPQAGGGILYQIQSLHDKPYCPVPAVKEQDVESHGNEDS